MTIFNINIDTSSGPKYLAIADALGEMIELGTIAAGQRLPTHRDLADQLGVTVGTVSRGYSEAFKRGLLVGEVGRGTFVRSSEKDFSEFASRKTKDPRAIDLSLNASDQCSTSHLIRAELRSFQDEINIEESLDYNFEGGHQLHRQVMSDWINRSGLESRPEQILITSGAQHGLLVTFSTIVEPGDLVCTASQTYPGIKALSSFLKFRLKGLVTDSDGIIPEAFERACREECPKAIYCVPTIQNPMATMIPRQRREEIARIARKYNVRIVEDDIYRSFVPDAPPPIASLAPEISYYINSLSKDISPGLRIGILCAPEQMASGLTTSLLVSTIMASPLCAELATRVIRSGRAETIVEIRRKETLERNTMARQTLGQYFAPGVCKESLHVWINLPEPCRADDFASQARGRGVHVAPSETFSVSKGSAPQAVRISLSAIREQAMLGRGLDIIKELLEHPPSPELSVL